jgi:hypothetical protein
MVKQLAWRAGAEVLKKAKDSALLVAVQPGDTLLQSSRDHCQ